MKRWAVTLKPCGRNSTAYVLVTLEAASKQDAIEGALDSMQEPGEYLIVLVGRA